MLIEDRQEQANILGLVILVCVLMLMLAMLWGGSCAASKASPIAHTWR